MFWPLAKAKCSEFSSECKFLPGHFVHCTVITEHFALGDHILYHSGTVATPQCSLYRAEWPQHSVLHWPHHSAMCTWHRVEWSQCSVLYGMTGHDKKLWRYEEFLLTVECGEIMDNNSPWQVWQPNLESSQLWQKTLKEKSTKGEKIFRRNASLPTASLLG